LGRAGVDLHLLAEEAGQRVVVLDLSGLSGRLICICEFGCISAGIKWGRLGGRRCWRCVSQITFEGDLGHRRLFCSGRNGQRARLRSHTLEVFCDVTTLIGVGRDTVNKGVNDAGLEAGGLAGTLEDAGVGGVLLANRVECYAISKVALFNHGDLVALKADELVGAKI
jgi:hypothetical protein